MCQFPRDYHTPRQPANSFQRFDFVTNQAAEPAARPALGRAAEAARVPAGGARQRGDR
jgi:hypothetical protein